MKKFLSIILFVLLSCNLNSQDNKLSLHFKRILFKELADTIEKTIPVKIYYSDKWTDTLYLDIDSENDSINDIFNKTLSKSGLSFIITPDNKIILSKGYTIKTSFRKEYLDYLEKNSTRYDTAKYVQSSLIKEDTLISDEYKVFKIGNPSLGANQDRAILSGTITNPVSGDPLAGVVVYIGKYKVGAVTNSVGYYSVEIPKGQCQVEYRMVGMRQTVRNLIIYSDGILNVVLAENTKQLNEVVVSASRENNVRNIRMGVEKINVRMLKQMPMGMGEVDLFKSSLLLPGVQSVGEASNGYNIRGGTH